MKRFVLFDIDGTLIYSGGAGLRALNRAMEDLLRIADGFREVNCAGKTDVEIMREGLRRWGIPSRDGLVPSLVDRYVLHLRNEMARSTGHMKPGVRELLPALQSLEGVSLGLLTGNLEQGARIKLEPFGLNPYFPVGAFGSDDEDRNRLLPVAIHKLREQAGISLGFGECIVIGDTPRDVACARIHGAPCIAVATGSYTVQDLHEAGAALVLEDLSDTEALVRWICTTR